MALTPAAQAMLASDGRFKTSAVALSSSPQLAEAEALTLATHFARHYAVHVKRYLESQRLAAINFAKLSPCGRILYAESPFTADTTAQIAVRNGLGPRWFVCLCSDGEPQLSVAVAALATEMQVDRDAIAFAESHGNEFFAVGIPSEWDGALAVSPEQAAILANQITKKRVNSVPRLVIVGPGWIPQAAQWLIDLEGEITEPGLPHVRQVFVGLRLDGEPASGRDAVVVQIPGQSLTASAASSSGKQLMPHVLLGPESPFEWKTTFVPFEAGRTSK
jgi:hypothetical protein